MKTHSRTGLVLGLIVGMALASAAFADAGGGNNTDGTDNGKGNGGVNNGNGNNTPAAPEPGIWLMAASGLALGGGYLLWRRKQLKSKSFT